MNITYDNTESQEGTINDDEIDLKELISVLWRGKILIILITSVFALCSVLYALSLTNYYKSEAVLIIQRTSQEPASLAGLGGLASMTGIRLPTSGEDKSMLVLETLKSRAFLKHLLAFENVLPSIMAVKSYDHQSKEISFDPEVYDADSGTWIREPTKNQQSKPSYLEVYETYLGQVLIQQDANPDLISISVEHISPIFAKEFLDLIINEVNELLRSKDLQESSDAIAFLTSEIPKASLITMQEATNLLLQSKLETQMMAKISTDYILKIIEPPFVPEKKSKPQRALICILGTMVGGVLALLWILIRHYILDGIKPDLGS